MKTLATQTYLGHGLLVLGIVVAAFIWVTFFAQVEISTLGDQGTYLSAASLTRLLGDLWYDNSVHPYGYILFVALLSAFAEFSGLSPLLAITQIQFLLHILTAALSVALLRQLAGKVSFRVGLLCFTLVVWQPALLGLTRHFLSDSVTALWLTLFFYGVALRSWRGAGLASLALGLAIVTRSFHLVWGGVFLGMLLVFALWSGWRITRANLRHVALCLLPCVLLIAIQFSVTWRVYGEVGFTSSYGQAWINDQLRWAVTYLKYETLVIRSPDNPDFRHVDGLGFITQPDSDAVPPTLLHLALQNPFEALAVSTVKLVGLFQPYEWTNYRDHDRVELNLVSVLGGVYFGLFVFLTGAIIARWRTYRVYLAEAAGSPVFYEGVFYLGALAYCAAYVATTAPETRFLAPLMPLIIVLALRQWQRGTTQHVLIGAVIISVVLYLLTLLVFATMLRVYL